MRLIRSSHQVLQEVEISRGTSDGRVPHLPGLQSSNWEIRGPLLDEKMSHLGLGLERRDFMKL